MRTTEEIERAVALLIAMAITMDDAGEDEGVSALLACVSILQWVKGDNSGPLSAALQGAGHQVTGRVN